MNYGILIAISKSGFQIVGAVDTLNEAHELAGEYVRFGPDSGYLAPEYFEVHSRGQYGGYTIVQRLK
jgi:hypothetical protein